jgi:SAM-dependent methyltransferase
LTFERDNYALHGLRLDGLGLEIGPSHNPIAAGLPGVNAKVLDHMDQADLVKKYTSLRVDTSRIQPVDYVWSGERYADLVGDERFDWVIASHVIEHVPDIVGFINECAEVMAPEGVLSLVVPDKRETFDFYRPPAGLGPVVDAHLQSRRMSSPGAIAEFEMFIADYDGSPTPRFMNPAAHAMAMMKRAEGGHYVDIHAWVFTPSSFRLLMEDLHALGLLQLRECAFAENGGEFYIKLSKAGAGPGVDRTALARRALDELTGIKRGVISDTQERLEQLVRERTALRAELEAVKRTLSWRITAPLRAVRRSVG